MNGRVDVFRTIVAGVAKHKDTQLVLSIGGQLDPKQIGPVPSNAIIVNHAPQLELLKKAGVCITHAGLNTVLESLAQGVPQVAIPITFEQPGVATRIAAKKTGVIMPFAKLTAHNLSTVLAEVIFPRATITFLDRNALRFWTSRDVLYRSLSSDKGWSNNRSKLIRTAFTAVGTKTGRPLK
jgi:UDP:flavonoid glycosyltransferase YjiC (YdhE family)